MRARTAFALFAFHVHHGLSPNADSWLRHCEAECAAWHLLRCAPISLAQAAAMASKQAARIGRYAALGDLCRAHGARRCC